MSAILSLLRNTYTVLGPRRHTTRAGDREVDWAVPVEIATIQGWIQPRRGTDQELHRGESTLFGRGYFPADSPLTAETRLRDRDGRVWRMEGPPLAKGGPSGPTHFECELVSVEWAKP